MLELYDSKSLASVSTLDSFTSVEPRQGLCHGYVFPKSGTYRNMMTVEMPLTDEMVGILCRRGRRRLHELKEVCQASLHVDKVRRILKISSSEDGIAAVQEQLVSLEGPRRDVPRPVWAELMRTRMQETGPEAALARLQEASGCRIHIERHEPKVRLFGSQTCVAEAEALLKKFDETVTERHVPVGDHMPNTAALEALAHSCGISVCAEDKQVTLLGLHDAVEKAAQELTEHVVNLRSGLGSAIPVVEASTPKAPSADLASLPSARLAPAPGKVSAPGKSQSGLRKKTEAKPGPRLPKRTECPTCGACPFCSGCGAVTSEWFFTAPPMAQQMPVVCDVASQNKAMSQGSQWQLQYFQPMMNAFPQAFPMSPQGADGGVMWMAPMPMDQGAAFQAGYVPMANAAPIPAP